MARVRSRLTGHAGWIQAVTFHDDGSTLASIDDDTACIWNIFTGECLHRLPVGTLNLFLQPHRSRLYRLSMISRAVFDLYRARTVLWWAGLCTNC